MIYLYTGTPGSGKSLKATREILAYLERGRNVIANYPVAPTKKAAKRGGRFFYWDNSQITPEALLQFARENHRRIHGREEKAQTLVVIDESQIMFNSREFRNGDRMAWISFFSKHRHLFYDVILIAQNDRMLDRQIRSLAEYEIIHRNTTNFGNIGLFIKLFRIRLFVAVSMYRGVNQKIGAQWFVLSRRDKKAYDSYLDFDLAESGPAVTIETTDAAPEPSRTGAGVRGTPRLAARLRGIWDRLTRSKRESSDSGQEGPVTV